MVDGVVLLVDATEGPMAQTKFVLAKALKWGLNPIVVFNKVDRESSRCDEVDSELFDLFAALEATEEQIEYPAVYASAKNGWAVTDNPRSNGTLREIKNGNMDCLFEAIIKHLPCPKVERNAPFSMLVTNLEANQFLGTCVLGRIQSGKVSIGDTVKSMSEDGTVIEQGKVARLFNRRGLEQVIYLFISD